MQEYDQTSPLISNEINSHVLREMLLNERLNNVLVPVVTSGKLKVIPGIVFWDNRLKSRLVVFVKA